MEQIINLHVEKLPYESYLATSDDIQRLIAQGRTAGSTLRAIIKQADISTNAFLKNKNCGLLFSRSSYPYGVMPVLEKTRNLS